MPDYDLEIERVIAEVRVRGAQRVALQFPEGLKDRAVDVAARIEAETSAHAIILTDPTYGACDLKPAQCEALGVDLLVHFGHTRFE